MVYAVLLYVYMCVYAYVYMHVFIEQHCIPGGRGCLPMFIIRTATVMLFLLGAAMVLAVLNNEGVL